jgi:hypothetical protein
MSIQDLTPWLLLAASIAAGLSGLLVLANNHEAIGPHGDASTRNRRIAWVLFVLSVSMLGWAVVWVVGTRAANLAGNNIGETVHKFLLVGVAVIVGVANYFRKRRERAQKRDVR